MYDPSMTQPMREELTRVGIIDLKTKADVDALMSKNEPTVIFVNSVCGCSGGSARPGFIKAIENSNVKPKNIATVFAGVDKDAVDAARSRMAGYPPSSPSLAIFRGGQIAWMMERHDIEGQDASMVSQILESAFKKFGGEKVDESVKIKDPFEELTISCAETKKLLDEGKIKLFDVRDESERSRANIEGNILITQALADEMTAKWDKTTPMVFMCKSGMRSMQAVMYFRQFGFTEVKNMRGGIDAWSREVDPAVSRY